MCTQTRFFWPKSLNSKRTGNNNNCQFQFCKIASTFSISYLPLKPNIILTALLLPKRNSAEGHHEWLLNDLNIFCLLEFCSTYVLLRVTFPQSISSSFYQKRQEMYRHRKMFLFNSRYKRFQ